MTSGRKMALLCLLLSAPTRACDVPVYRFALEYWQRDPYYVTYFYRGRPDPADAEANAVLRRLAEGRESKLNLVFSAEDVDKIDHLPASAGERYLWKQHRPATLPAHTIISPREVVLFSGRLGADEAKALASPDAARLSRMLGGGKAGVFVLLRRGAPADNAAETLVRKAVGLLRNEDQQDVDMLVVRRDEHAERWLVRQLLGAAPHLSDKRGPMVFIAFGRGRVLQPFVGKDITVENLRAMVEFVTGPCSCTLQGSGMGVDLLTDFDWEAAAARLEAAAEEAPAAEPEDFAAPAAPDVSEPPTALAAVPRLRRNVLVALGVLLLAAALGGWLVWRRVRRA